MGYLAEMDGDRETADYYYAKAREADQSTMKVAYATRKDMEGMKLAAVAGDSDDAVIKATEEAAAARRAEGGPVVCVTAIISPWPSPQPHPNLRSRSRLFLLLRATTNYCSRCLTTNSLR